MTLASLTRLRHKIQMLIVEESYRAHVGHIGCSLSIVDLLTCLYRDFLTPKDNFILSKGHAALGLYATLTAVGKMPRSLLAQYHTDGSHIGTHPEMGIAGVELATGSLGQGLGVGAGIALGKKLRGDTSQTVVLLSDAECNEGSVWEAIAFCGHHQLNILAIVDVDGQQGFGYTKDVLDLAPLSEKWAMFKWKTTTIPGHDLRNITKTLAKMRKSSGPRVILADTILGHGVSFMERKVDWHYLPLTDELYAQAKADLKGIHA